MLALLTLLLASCAPVSPTVEYDGRQLSSEEIRQLGESFLLSETETETEPETEKETKEPADGIVHWTAGGSVWHESRACSRLSRSSTVVTGTVDEAIAAKKGKGCSFCCE